MNVLGNAGSIYMVVLIFLLIVGLGLVIKGLFHMMIGNNQKKFKHNGGGFMQNQSVGWLKLAMISFIGIIIGLMLLSFIAPYGMNGISMGMGSGGDSMMNSSAGNMASHHSGSSTGSMSSMNSPMIQSGVSSANLNNMMQTLNQMQLQISQMQQQIMVNPSMPQGGMNTGGMSSGGASSGSSGGSGSGMM